MNNSDPSINWDLLQQEGVSTLGDTHVWKMISKEVTPPLGCRTVQRRGRASAIGPGFGMKSNPIHGADLASRYHMFMLLHTICKDLLFDAHCSAYACSSFESKAALHHRLPLRDADGTG